MPYAYIVLAHYGFCLECHTLPTPHEQYSQLPTTHNRSVKKRSIYQKWSKGEYQRRLEDSAWGILSVPGHLKFDLVPPSLLDH